MHLKDHNRIVTCCAFLVCTSAAHFSSCSRADMPCNSFNLLISLVLAMRVSIRRSHQLCNVEIAESPAHGKAEMWQDDADTTAMRWLKRQFGKRQKEKEDEGFALTRGQYCEGCSGPDEKQSFALCPDQLGSSATVCLFSATQSGLFHQSFRCHSQYPKAVVSESVLYAAKRSFSWERTACVLEAYVCILHPQQTAALLQARTCR